MVFSGLTKYAVILLAGFAIILCSYLFGYSHGKAKAEVQYVVADNAFLKEWTRIAADIGNSFAELVAKLETKKAEVHYVIKEVVKEGERYVEETDQHVSVDPYLRDLRLCAYDALYQAADARLPAEREGVACPPALPVQ
jgi:hypothetical protein